MNLYFRLLAAVGNLCFLVSLNCFAKPFKTKKPPENTSKLQAIKRQHSHNREGDASAKIFQTGSKRENSNVIFIYGKKKELKLLNKNGIVINYAPSQLSPTLPNELLKSQANVLQTSIGEINANGFSIPRLRGHETKLTEVWLDGTQLIDPFSGLSFSDFDFKPLGLFQLYTGVTPFNHPTTNPIGSISFKQKNVTKSSKEMGLTVGDIYGQKAWAQISQNFFEESYSLMLKNYLRTHRASGRYTYFNNNGTPYNREDDHLDVRKNNDTHSWQWLPIAEFKYNDSKLRLIGLRQQGEKGLPAVGDEASSKRAAWSQSLAIIRFEENYDLDFVDQLGGSLSWFNSSNNIEDPYAFMMTSMVSHHRQASFDYNWSRDLVNLYAKAGYGVGAVQYETSSEGRFESVRNQLSYYLGMRIGKELGLNGEIKGEYRSFLDARNDASDYLKKNTALSGLSVSIGWQGERLGTYLQQGIYKKPPTLLESFGDGGMIAASFDLLAEKISHFEIGVRYKMEQPSIQLLVAKYRDIGKHKIVFVPALASRQKAINLGSTIVDGVDFIGQMEFSAFQLSLTGNFLTPYEQTTSGKRVIPRTPKSSYSLLLTYRVWNSFIKLQTLYQGLMFQDPENNVYLPQTLIHDVFWDYEYDSAIFVGLTIKNASNVMAMDINPSHLGQGRGRVGYSSVEGYPLPGREFIGHITYAF